MHAATGAGYLQTSGLKWTLTPLFGTAIFLFFMVASRFSGVFRLFILFLSGGGGKQSSSFRSFMQARARGEDKKEREKEMQEKEATSSEIIAPRKLNESPEGEFRQPRTSLN